MLRRSARRHAAPTVAIAGAGYVAVVHALAARAAGLRVHAVASAGGRSARHLAGQLDARRCRPEDLPAGADVLIVATPPASHLPLALQGMRAGSRVLVEKPLTATLAEADALVAADADSSAIVRCAENLLHAPVCREAVRRRVALGPLRHLSLRTVQPSPDWGHFREPLTTGGVLFDLGPHAVAIALALAAEDPVAVAAELTTNRTDGADDLAEVRIRFGSGLIAELTVSWRADHGMWDAQAAGEGGVVRLELLPDVQLEVDGDPVPVLLRHSVPDPRLEQLGYVDQLLDVVASDPDGAPAGQTLTDARRVLEVICAGYASAGDGGAEVPLPFTGDRSATPLLLWRG